MDTTSFDPQPTAVAVFLGQHVGGVSGMETQTSSAIGTLWDEIEWYFRLRGGCMSYSRSEAYAVIVVRI